MAAKGVYYDMFFHYSLSAGKLHELARADESAKCITKKGRTMMQKEIDTKNSILSAFTQTGQSIKHVIDPGRMAHMYGCAEYMYNHALEYGLNPDAMYLIGLVHDIGYIHGKLDHEYTGAGIHGITDDVAKIIQSHGTTPKDYAESHGIFEFEIPKELVLLWDADMHINDFGEDVGYDGRLMRIVEKYGKHSHPYWVCHETIEWLKANKDKFLE